MADIDPDTLLEWLTIGMGDERDMQLVALEQLCMLLLMSDNVDRCFESCPPRSFLPALCHIFMDDTAPDNILEVTARAITYYLDVSAECSRRIVTVDGAVKALCARLLVVDINSRTSKDVAEQCVKVMELMCTREAGAIYEAGGLSCMLTFIREYSTQIHKDTLHSAMSVVARLCGKMEPTDATLESCMDSLSKLLHHEDSYVADPALKCFACLADRFTRRGVDPAPLAKHGLAEELLKKLVSSALACSTDKNTSLNSSMSDSRNSSGNVSIIVSVLSMLCRGSPTVTHDLLRSSLPEAIETAMQGDERCVLDTMRLVDLLLILLFEGRMALPKSTLTSRGAASVLRKQDSSGERSHRQLIDCIRSKDTDALIEAIDSGTYDVNFMDDVGQTLLNWASAFGTVEMVEFLCERGADVNRGQRSSSLHYAACFGRPAVAKVLLRYGANPELRDEDGKAPLDKARERNDEGHWEVVQILQAPGEWMSVPQDQIAEAQGIKPESAIPGAAAEITVSGEQQVASTENTDDGVKGDPEMATVYVKKLVPVFARTYQSSLLLSIKKATLAILKKMIHYIPEAMMSELVTGDTAAQLVDVVATTLRTEDDSEGHLTALCCVHDLMTKGSAIFAIHFIRLGVLQRITEMASDLDESQDDVIDGKISNKEEASIHSDDATKVHLNRPYHWHDWCLVRGRDCLYLWNDFCAIELSNGSNGWFRFVLDGKLATMYSSGSPEGGSSSSESRSEFLDKLQRARAQVTSSAISQPILSTPGGAALTVGNWSLRSLQEGHLVVVNTDGQQTTTLKDDLPGFLFESNRGTKHTFTAETSLGPDFAMSWSGKPGRKYQSKNEQIKQKLAALAQCIYCKFFKDADLTPHGSTAKLHEISERLNSVAHAQEGRIEEKRCVILNALKDLCKLLQEESMLSSYEIQSSGLVTALNNCLNKTMQFSGGVPFIKDPLATSELFKHVFGKMAQTVALDESFQTISPSVCLIRKLVMVLESTERLPVLSYENVGGGSGLQILSRRMRFKLERASRSFNLINRTGHSLKLEPLTTVAEVEKYLSKMVAKQWFDHERASFKFVQHFKNGSGDVCFNHESDFDENGVMYWIGTNAKTVSEWVNPGRHGLVSLLSSDGRSLPYGRLEDILSRDRAALNCHTSDNRSSWFIIDVGLWVIPSAYTLRHARGYGRSALRSWLFQASKDGESWTTLRSHINDESLNDPGSTFTWALEPREGEVQGWHIFRLQQNGPNASGQTHYLSVSGFELYGKVTAAVDDLNSVSASEDESAHERRQRRVFRSQILRHMARGGKQGSGWKALQDEVRVKAMASENRHNAGKNDSWVDVSWPQGLPPAVAGRSNGGSTFNVKVVDISDPEVQASMQEIDRRSKNESNRSLRQATLDNALRQVVSSFGKKNSSSFKDLSSTVTRNSDEKMLRLDSESSDPGDEGTDGRSGGSRIDLANLQFLMAVEDLLDSSSSDLVANALAEAASLHVDQLRSATRTFRSSLLEAGGLRPTPSAQSSRESRSPPTELNTPPPTESSTPSNDCGQRLGAPDPKQIAAELVTDQEELFNDGSATPRETGDANSETENASPSLKPELATSSERSPLTRRECMEQIQQIATSMNEVLESMKLVSVRDAGVEDGMAEHGFDQEGDGDGYETPPSNTLNVEENNFLNDHQHMLEPTVISLLNDDDDDDGHQEPDEDDSDDDENLRVVMDDHSSDEDGDVAMYKELISDIQANSGTSAVSPDTETHLPSATLDEAWSSQVPSSELMPSSSSASRSESTLVSIDFSANLLEAQLRDAFLQLDSNLVDNTVTTMFAGNSEALGSTSLDAQAGDQGDLNSNEHAQKCLSASMEQPHIETLDYSVRQSSPIMEEICVDDLTRCRSATYESRDLSATCTQDVLALDRPDRVDSYVVIDEGLASNRGEDLGTDTGEFQDMPIEGRTRVETRAADLAFDSGSSVDHVSNLKDENGRELTSPCVEEDCSEVVQRREELFVAETSDAVVVDLVDASQSETRSVESDPALSYSVEAPTSHVGSQDTNEMAPGQRQADVESKSGREEVESVEELEMDEGEDDDDDDDDEFDDIENEDEIEVEDLYEPLQGQHRGTFHRYLDAHRRLWDEDLVLKRQHAALVPAFDPRPGRTNAQQTHDIEIPSADTLQAARSGRQRSPMRLFIKGSPAVGGKEVEVCMDNPDATVFSYVQSLVLHTCTAANRSDKLRRVWEPSYTIVYKSTEASDDVCGELSEQDVIKWSPDYVEKNVGTLDLPKSELINYMQQNAGQEFLKKWKLTGTTRTCRKQRNCSVLTAAYKEFAQMKLAEANSETSKLAVDQVNGSVSTEPPTVAAKSDQPVDSLQPSLDDLSQIQSVLDVIKSLHRLAEDIGDSVSLSDEYLFEVGDEEFLSKKLTNKLQQQIQDPLVLASGALPLWCEYLVINYPMLFPFETRQMFFRATAFGCSRSIVWLQNLNDANLERSRGLPARRSDAHDYRIGRLKHERATVPRGRHLLETAVRLMDFHAERKAVLEVEFQDEEGTGLGPSLEFYALVALEIQRIDLQMWVSVDVMKDFANEMSEASAGDLMKYVRHPSGLFPAPLPQDFPHMEQICQRFTFLGIFLAKCLQDSRLVDIPLSEPFFKMLCAGKGRNTQLSRTMSQSSDLRQDCSCLDDSSPEEVFDTSVGKSVEKMDAHYFSEVLTDTDFQVVHPHIFSFIRQLKRFMQSRSSILCDRKLSDVEREKLLKEQVLETEHGQQCHVEDLGLNFQYIPSSTVFGLDAIDLKPGGGSIELTSENAEEYVQLMSDFCMHKGIARQLEAFRAGFNRVFPMEKLHAFKPREVQLMLCGEQAPKWTREELMMYTEPKIGFTKDSPGFLRLVNVLVNMSGNERKAFLQFATGCSSLPSGGIANLHPRLTIVKKNSDGDGSFPSVNTCVHYLKLPEYSSEEVLRERLLAATIEKGFHLN